MCKNLKIIILWDKNYENEYQKLIKNYSCFEYNFISI